MTTSPTPPADQVREVAVEAVARRVASLRFGAEFHFDDPQDDLDRTMAGVAREIATELLLLPAVSALLTEARADELEQAGTELAHDHRHYVEVALSGADYVQQWLADRASHLRAAVRQTDERNDR